MDIVVVTTFQEFQLPGVVLLVKKSGSHWSCVALGRMIG